VARTGEQALDLARQRVYDFILLDWELPDMLGADVCREIREFEKSRPRKKSRIIALSAHAPDKIRAESKHAGMDDCLGKPVRLEQLREALASGIESMSGSGNGGDEGGESHEFGLDPEVLSDLKMLSADDGGNAIQELLQIFFEDSPSNFCELEIAFQEKDFAIIASRAHKLGGSASLFGALGFRDLCRDLEAAAREQNIQKVEECMPRLKFGYEKTVQALEALQESL
jgi:CheY-like chemotaxis protein/HPt (histidine-containing phosphotransfer) domain-containing protein